MNYERELKFAGALNVKFYLNQLLSLADAASLVGREDIAARLTCYGAEIATYSKPVLPKLTPLVPELDTARLEDFLSMETLYVGDRESLQSLGLPAIGCNSYFHCSELITDFVRRHHVKRVVIVAGLGAERLQAALPVPSVIWTPSTKDARAFVQAGGTAAMIRNACRDLTWTQPS